MTTISKTKIRTLTLAIGILTALLLIFGTFTMSGESTVGDSVLSWVYQSSPLSELVQFSSSLIKSVSALVL